MLYIANETIEERSVSSRKLKKNKFGEYNTRTNENSTEITNDLVQQGR